MITLKLHLIHAAHTPTDTPECTTKQGHEL